MRRPCIASALIVGALAVTAVGCGSDQSSNPAAARNFTNTEDNPNPPGTGGTNTGGSEGTTSGDTTAPASSTETAPTTTPEASPRSGGDESAEITVNADPQKLAFDQTTLQGTAGRITVTMANPSDIPHNIAFDQPEKAEGKVVGKGGKSRVTLTFPAGRYQYYCSVPGHRQAGMVGTLIVK